MEKENEQELIGRIREDPQQFGVLFDAHYPAIFNYLFRRIGDYDAAADVASETFMKAFLNIGKFQYRGIPISFWLYRIANNEMQQYYRHEKYRPGSLDQLIDASDWDMAEAQGAAECQARSERETKQDADFLFIQQAIKNFPPLYQDALALRYFEQKSIKEVAAILGKKEGTVKSLLSRGVEKLRLLL